MDLYHQLLEKETKLAVIGLGYVGLPLAVAFARETDVIGYDANEGKIQSYKEGTDATKEVGDEAVRESGIRFTSDPSCLKEAKFLVVAVPTPIREDRTPDLSPVESATRTVGRNLTQGAVVVYESTVYPGVTEDVCVPILEAESGLACGRDFKVGYSPERINPADKEHVLANITKIVSGMDAETLDTVADVYDTVAWCLEEYGGKKEDKAHVQPE